MPNYKVLNSIAHNLGQDYVSTLNYLHEDYAMGHLLNHALKTNISTLNIDILKGVAEENVDRNSVAWSVIKKSPEVLKRLVKSEGGSMETIKTAKMRLSFDLNSSRPNERNSKLIEYPYTLRVDIADDRNAEHSYTHTGWWFEEPRIKKLSSGSWFRGLFT